MPGRQYDLVPIGPVEVRVRTGAPVSAVRLHVAGGSVPFECKGDAVVFTVGSIADHELVEIAG